jgi:gas vesicle protein
MGISIEQKIRKIMDARKTIITVMVGVAVGAVLGVLIAPKKGKNIRKNIIRKGEDLAEALNDKIDQKFDDLISAISGKVKKAKPQSDYTPSSKSELVS